MSTIQKIDRRDFVKLFGLASGGIILGCSVAADSKDFIPSAHITGFNPNLFIHLQKKWKYYFNCLPFRNGTRY